MRYPVDSFVTEGITHGAFIDYPTKDLAHDNSDCKGRICEADVS